MISAAYAAGFIDGEGCIRVNRLRSTSGSIAHAVALAVTNTDLSVLRLLKEYFGVGSIHEKKVEPGYRRCYVWTASRRMAVRVLKEVLPFLVVKRQQAELSIKFQEEMIGFSGYKKLPQSVYEAREEIVRQIHNLNSRHRYQAEEVITK